MTLDNLIEIGNLLTALVGSLQSVIEANEDEVAVALAQSILDNSLLELDTQIAAYISETEPSEDIETFGARISAGIETLIASVENIISSQTDEVAVSFAQGILDNSLLPVRKLLEASSVPPVEA